MRSKVLVVLFIVTMAAFLTFTVSNTALADSPSANNATVDITIHDSGGVSVGGVDLSTLGVLPLDSQVVTAARDLGDAQVTVDNSAVTVNVQNTEVAKLVWTPASRQTAVTLAQRYGVQLNPAIAGRLEEWISASNVNVTARFTNDISKPLSVNLTKPVIVDIASNGQLSVENIPLAAAITTTAVQTMQMGGSQATACWRNGTLSAKVDGQDLPTLTLNPDGVNLVTKALNLPVDSNATSEVLNATLGVDLSLPGGTHDANANCGAT
jgi:hypothetical protein